MVRLSTMNFKCNKYKPTVNKELLESTGSIFAKHTFKSNNITVSVLADSEYSTVREERYEVALFRDDCPLDLPQEIKEEYGDRIVFKFFIANLDESEVNKVIKIAAMLP